MNDHSFNVNFVNLIKEYPCLYDTNNEDYSKREIVEDAWTQIADEVKHSVSACKDRWRNLRTVFLRHVKKCIRGWTLKRPYYLYDTMKFILPFSKGGHLLMDGISSSDFNIDGEQNLSDPEDTQSKNNSNSFFDEIDKQSDRVETRKRPHDGYSFNMDNADVQDTIIKTEEPIKRYRSEDVDAVCNNAAYEYDNCSDNAYFMYTPAKRKQRSSYNEIVASVNKSASASTSTNTQNKNECSDNPNLQFLHSLLPDVSKMNDSQVRKFKINVLQIIDEILVDSNDKVATNST